jgi:energy-coupling factor transport system permease protein
VNPRAAGAWSLAALAIAVSTTNPVYRGVVALCALNLILARGRPGVRLRPLLVTVAVAAAIATVVSLLLSHTGAHRLLQVPAGVPAIGGAITFESLVFGLVTGLGIAAALLAVAPLTLVADPYDLVDALPSPLARTVAAIGTALNLIPGMVRSAAEIRDAQRLRGWRPHRVRDWPDVAVPVVLTAVESSITLAEAMEARGWGSGPRTHYLAPRRSWFDVVVASTALLAGAAFLALRASGAVPDWYPFPTISPLAVNPAALACCLVLILPSFGRDAH